MIKFYKIYIKKCEKWIMMIKNKIHLYKKKDNKINNRKIYLKI